MRPVIQALRMREAQALLYGTRSAFIPRSLVRQHYTLLMLHCKSRSDKCGAHSTLTTAACLLLLLICLWRNHDSGAVCGAWRAFLRGQRLLADNVVDLREDLLEGQLHVGAFEGTGLDE